MYHRSALTLVLLSVYCYASPVPSVDQNQQQSAFVSTKINEQSDMMEPIVSKTNHEIQLIKLLNEFYRLKMLCALYDGCNDNDGQQIIGSDDTKHKRLSSSLFHGIPKFGKRAFSSAFAGIPKFG